LYGSESYKEEYPALPSTRTSVQSEGEVAGATCPLPDYARVALPPVVESSDEDKQQSVWLNLADRKAVKQFFDSRRAESRKSSGSSRSDDAACRTGIVMPSDDGTIEYFSDEEYFPYGDGFEIVYVGDWAEEADLFWS